MPAELTSGFLVASPSLQDPNFKKAVVLLATHKSEGSLGFVVNRPAGMKFSEVASELGIGENVIPDIPVLHGGPVSPETGWLVYDPDAAEARDAEGIIKVSDSLHISTSRDHLEEVANDSGASRHVLVLGYAGWGAGQLADEIKSGAWIPVDLDENLVFSTPVDDRWKAALASIGIDPSFLVKMPSSFS